MWLVNVHCHAVNTLSVDVGGLANCAIFSVTGCSPTGTHAASINATILVTASTNAHPRSKVNKPSPENPYDFQCAPLPIERQKEVDGVLVEISTIETPTDAPTNLGISGSNIPPGQTLRNPGLPRDQHLHKPICNQRNSTT